MDELTGPVIGIALVLSAVFVPTVFIPGITGRLYQQFALTIAISVIVSAFNALTLSPALGAHAAPAQERDAWARWRGSSVGSIVFLRAARNFYLRISGGLIRKSALAVVALAGFAVARRLLCESAAVKLPARRGPGIHVHPNATARSLFDSEHGRSSPGRGRCPEGHSRGQALHHRCRIQSPQPDPQHLQRILLGDPAAVGRPEENRGAVSGDQGEVEPEADHASARDGVRLLSAGNCGSRHFGRISVRAGRPLRTRVRIPGEQPE